MPATEPRAPLIALAAAALFGVSTPLVKLLVGDVGPWLLAGLLYLGSGVGLTALYFIRRAFTGNSGEARLTRADLPWLAGTVVFGGILGPILLLFGLLRTDAASASLLLNLEAVFTLGLAWVVFESTWTGGSSLASSPSSRARYCFHGKADLEMRVGERRSSRSPACHGASTTT